MGLHLNEAQHAFQGPTVKPDLVLLAHQAHLHAEQPDPENPSVQAGCTHVCAVDTQLLTFKYHIEVNAG